MKPNGGYPKDGVFSLFVGGLLLTVNRLFFILFGAQTPTTGRVTDRIQVAVRAYRRNHRDDQTNIRSKIIMSSHDRFLISPSLPVSGRPSVMTDERRNKDNNARNRSTHA